MPAKHHTRNIILKMVQANPQVRMRTLLDAVEMSNAHNVRYHLERLEAEGLIHWEGDEHPKSGWQIRNALRWEYGDIGMRRMTKSELEKRIDAVVRKAQAKACQGEQPGVDVIHDFRHRMSRSLKASRVG